MRSPKLRPRRLLLTAALAVGTAIALAACGGIPTSGDVTAGEPVNDDVELDVGFAPQGPRPDATQEEIMQEFIIAATNPQGDFQIAREFLAKGFAEVWDPEALTTIRTGVGTQRRDSDTVLNYSLVSAASVSSEGRYAEGPPESVNLQFSFVKEGKQWRISEAPDGIVLSRDSFDVVFDEYPLYFFDPSYQFLVPDVRWFPNRSRSAIRVVAATLAGPSSWLGGVLTSAFPAGTQLGEGLVDVTSGVATVDLSEEARSATTLERERMRQQLSASMVGVSNVVITVGGIPLPIPETGQAAAVTTPVVEPAPLVLREGEFGFATNENITSLGAIGTKIAALAPTAVTLARGKTEAAVLAGGTVYIVRGGSAAPLVVDTRPGLAAPSIDNAGYVWSVPEANASAIRVFSLDGTAHDVASTLAPDARVVSMAVSRDGARLLLYLSTSSGPQLTVYGILRQDGVPVGLGEPFPLPVTSETPVGAAWVDNRTVATLSAADDETVVRSFGIGGPSVVLGQLEAASTIVGGNAGTDGLRVLSGDQLYRPRGTSWQQTGTTAQVLATQQ